MNRRSGWVAAVIVVGAAAGLGTWLVPSEWAAPVTAGVLAATLTAIFWYSWDTHTLVAVQRQAAELEQHPWLSATTLKPEEIKDGADPGLFGGYKLWLPITNVGKSPAYSLRVEASHTTRVPGLEDHEGRREFRNQVIVPGDVGHYLLGEAFFNRPKGNRAVDLLVQVTYEAVDRSRGHLYLNFQYRDDRGWGNGDTRYVVTLRDGRRWSEAE